MTGRCSAVQARYEVDTRSNSERDLVHDIERQQSDSRRYPPAVLIRPHRAGTVPCGATPPPGPLQTVAGQATPAITLLAQQRVTHQLHPYEVDPDTANYGAAVADILGIAQARVFKTLVTEVDGALTVAVVPVTGDVDLKALAGAVGGRRAARADR